jgi:protein phosphatase
MKTDKQNLEVGAVSETGYVRKENQDRMSWSSVPWGQLYIVADGMGGHVGGAQAAELTVHGLEQHLSEASKDISVEDAIHKAFEKTNKNVNDKAHVGDPKTEGMGSTAVMLLISGRIAKIAHVGDSRAYLYRHGKLRLLTKDHTQVQRMVDAGMLTEEQARDHPSASVLDRAIGHRPTVIIDIEPDLLLNDGDGILLCSDGLTGYADDQEIESVMDNSLSLQENVDRLFNLALQKGGEDNITIQFIGYKKKPSIHSKKFKGAFNSIMIAILLFGIISAASYQSYIVARKTGEDKLSTIKTQLDNQIAQQRQQIAQQHQQIEGLNNQISQLENKLSDRVKDITKIENTKNKYSNETFRLKKRLSSEKQENIELKEKFELLEQENISAKKLNLSYQEKIKNLQKKVSELKLNLVSLKTRLLLFEGPLLLEVPQVPKSVTPKEENNEGQTK